MQLFQESETTSLNRGSKTFPGIPNSTPKPVLLFQGSVYLVFIWSIQESGDDWSGGSYGQITTSPRPLPQWRECSGTLGMVGDGWWANTIGWVELLNIFMPWNIWAGRNLASHSVQSLRAITEEIKSQRSGGIFLRSHLPLGAGHSPEVLSLGSWFCALSTPGLFLGPAGCFVSFPPSLHFMQHESLLLHSFSVWKEKCGAASQMRSTSLYTASSCWQTPVGRYTKDPERGPAVLSQVITNCNTR